MPQYEKVSDVPNLAMPEGYRMPTKRELKPILDRTPKAGHEDFQLMLTKGWCPVSVMASRLSRPTASIRTWVNDGKIQSALLTITAASGSRKTIIFVNPGETVAENEKHRELPGRRRRRPFAQPSPNAPAPAQMSLPLTDADIMPMNELEIARAKTGVFKTGSPKERIAEIDEAVKAGMFDVKTAAARMGISHSTLSRYIIKKHPALPPAKVIDRVTFLTADTVRKAIASNVVNGRGTPTYLALDDQRGLVSHPIQGTPPTPAPAAPTTEETIQARAENYRRSGKWLIRSVIEANKGNAPTKEILKAFFGGIIDGLDELGRPEGEKT